MYKLGNKRLNLWDEPFMQSQQMTSDLKILYLYLLSNDVSNIAGVYKITNRRILFDLCNPSLNLKVLFFQLRRMKKVYRCGDYVIIKDAPLYIKKMTKPIIKEMDEILYELPDKIKTKMKKIHYKYAHLYGELLYEELQKLGTGKVQLDMFSKTKKCEQLILFEEGENEIIGIKNKDENQFVENQQNLNENKSLGHTDRDNLNETIEEDIVEKASVENMSKDEKILEKNNKVSIIGLPQRNIFNSKEKPEVANESNVHQETEPQKEPNLTLQDGQYKFGSLYTMPINKFEEKLEETTKEDEAPRSSFIVNSEAIENMQKRLAMTIFKEFQKEGFYEGIAFNYFYAADFKKGLEYLRQRAVTVEDYKEAFQLELIVSNYIKVAKLQQLGKTWFDEPIFFYRMCIASVYNKLTPEEFDIKTFMTMEEPIAEVVDF